MQYIKMKTDSQARFKDKLLTLMKLSGAKYGPQALKFETLGPPVWWLAAEREMWLQFVALDLGFDRRICAKRNGFYNLRPKTEYTVF